MKTRNLENKNRIWVAVFFMALLTFLTFLRQPIQSQAMDDAMVVNFQALSQRLNGYLREHWPRDLPNLKSGLRESPAVPATNVLSFRSQQSLDTTEFGKANVSADQKGRQLDMFLLYSLWYGWLNGGSQLRQFLATNHRGHTEAQMKLALTYYYLVCGYFYKAHLASGNRDHTYEAPPDSSLEFEKYIRERIQSFGISRSEFGVEDLIMLHQAARNQDTKSFTHYHRRLTLFLSEKRHRLDDAVLELTSCYIHLLLKPSKISSFCPPKNAKQDNQDPSLAKQFLQLLIPPDYSAINQDELVSSLQQTIPKVLGGSIKLSGSMNLQIQYFQSEDEKQAIILKKERPLLMTQSGTVLLIKSNGVYRIVSSYDGQGQIKSTYFSIHFSFPQHSGQHQFNFNFNLANEPYFDIPWSEFIAIFDDDQFMAFGHPSLKRYRFIRHNFANPLQNRLINLERYDNLSIRSIEFCTLDATKCIYIDRQLEPKRLELTQFFPMKLYAKGKDSFFRDAEFPVAIHELNDYLFRAVLNSTDHLDKNSNGNIETASQIRQNIYQILKEDLFSSQRYQSDEYRFLARRYLAYSSGEYEIPELFAVSGYLFFEGYEFEKSLQLYRQYFRLRDEVENSQNQLHIQLPAVENSFSIYLNAMMQAAEYEQALDMLNRGAEIKADINDSKDPEQNLLQQMVRLVQSVDIYARMGDWSGSLSTMNHFYQMLQESSGQQSFKNLEQWQRLTSLVKRAALTHLRILGFRQQFDQISLWKNRWLVSLDKHRNKKILPSAHESYESNKQLWQNAFLKEFPSDWPLANEKGIRLPFIPPLSGQGKNYCVPNAIQFVMRFFGHRQISQKEIAQALGTDEFGTGFSAMLAYMVQQDYHAIAFLGNPNRVSQYLAMGYPVLTLLHPKGSELGHIVAIIGVDQFSRLYYAYDPAEEIALTTMQASDLQRLQVRTGGIFIAFMPNSDLRQLENRYSSNHTGLINSFYHGSELANLTLNYLDQLTADNWDDDPWQLLTEIETKDTQKQMQDFLLYQRLLIVLDNIDAETLSSSQRFFLEEVLRDQLAAGYNLSNIQGFSLLLARIAFIKKDFSQAKQLLLPVMRDQDQTIEKTILLAQIYAELGQYQLAVEMYLRTITLMQRGSLIGYSQGDIWMLLAQLAEKNVDHKMLHRSLSMLVVHNPGHAGLGQYYQKMLSELNAKNSIIIHEMLKE